MALIDMFASSFSGMQNGLSLLQQSARTIADPATWGTSSSTAFHEILTAQIAAVSGNGGRDGEGRPTGTARIVYTRMTPDVQGMAPSGDDLLGAMVNALIARRIIEANARMISIENSVVWTIIDLGKY